MNKIIVILAPTSSGSSLRESTKHEITLDVPGMEFTKENHRC